MLLDNEEGATEAMVAKAPQIPHPRMPIKVDDPVVSVSVIPMGRSIPPQNEPKIPPQSRQVPKQEVSLAVIVANPSRRPKNVLESSREVMRCA